MKIPPIEIRGPQSMDQALSMLASLGSDARILAGGQSLLPMLRYRVISPYALVDISRLADLRNLKMDDRQMSLGALVTHRDIEQLPVRDGEPGAMELLRQHAAEIAFVPIRSRGTVVGSLLHADPKGDWPLALFALGAQVELRSLRGARTLSLHELISGPLQTNCAVDELAVSVNVAAERLSPLAWGRSKLVHRAGEYAMCASVVLQYESGWECWVGALGDFPFLLETASAMLSDAEGESLARDLPLREAAMQDLRKQVPELTMVEAYRHAQNMIDALAQARSRQRAKREAKHG